MEKRYLYRSRCELCGCIHHEYECDNYEEWVSAPGERTYKQDDNKFCTYIKEKLTTCDIEGFQCE